MYLDSRLVKVDEIVTHEIPLKDYGQALKLMDERKAIKIAIVP